jgi:hypothetical protein
LVFDAPFVVALWNCYILPMASARSTLLFASLHDHARLPARFFGRFTAAAVAGLRSL